MKKRFLYYFLQGSKLSVELFSLWIMALWVSAMGIFTAVSLYLIYSDQLAYALASIALESGTGFAEVYSALGLALVVMLGTLILVFWWLSTVDDIDTNVSANRSRVNVYFKFYPEPITAAAMADDMPGIYLDELQRVLDTMADNKLINREPNPDPDGPDYLYSPRPKPKKGKQPSAAIPAPTVGE